VSGLFQLFVSGFLLIAAIGSAWGTVNFAKWALEVINRGDTWGAVGTLIASLMMAAYTVLLAFVSVFVLPGLCG
jgi:hypothetical protein